MDKNNFFPKLSISGFEVLEEPEFSDLLQPKDYQEQIIECLSKDLSKKREYIIIERIKKICPDFDFEEEKKRTFKRLALIQHNNRDEFYFNDGSEKGILIITFFYESHNINFDTKNGTSSVSWTLKYI